MSHHVIGFETQAYREMHNFYTDQGNRAAACVTASYIVLQERQENYGNKGNLARIDSLISEYADLQEAGELAIERYLAMCARRKWNTLTTHWGGGEHGRA